MNQRGGWSPFFVEIDFVASVPTGFGRFFSGYIHCIMSASVSAEIEPLVQKVTTIAVEALDDDSLYLVDLSIRGHKGSRVVDIYIDGDEGVSVDKLAKLSREIGFRLETEDVIQGRYQLNVSSPGADKPLCNRRQYPKHTGRTLIVTYTTAPGLESREIEGELKIIDSDSIEITDASGQKYFIEYDHIETARVKLPW